MKSANTTPLGKPITCAPCPSLPITNKISSVRGRPPTIIHVYTAHNAWRRRRLYVRNMECAFARLEIGHFWFSPPYAKTILLWGVSYFRLSGGVLSCSPSICSIYFEFKQYTQRKRNLFVHFSTTIYFQFLRRQYTRHAFRLTETILLCEMIHAPLSKCSTRGHLKMINNHIWTFRIAVLAEMISSWYQLE